MYANNDTTLWLLGAMDPEMLEIQHLLDRQLARWAYATDRQGVPVGPGGAYQARKPDLREYEHLILVECGGPWLQQEPEGLYATDGGEIREVCGQIAGPPYAVPVTVVDHHRPGDPGWGRDPAEAVVASSLGQAASLLHVKLDPRQRTVAAMDHCLPAAARGIVPGVDPETVVRVRVDTMIASPDVADGDAAATYRGALIDTLRAIQVLSGALHLYMGGAEVADLRDLPLPEDNAPGGSLPGLPTVACLAGRAYLARVREPGGAVKVVLGGDGPGTRTAGNAAVSFAEWALAHGYVRPYGGDPMRGFAGAYEPS